jgi:hypothetical protein
MPSVMTSCYNCAGKVLDSVVMTTRAENRISHGLLVVFVGLLIIALMWHLTLIVLPYHMHTDMTHSEDGYTRVHDS